MMKDLTPEEVYDDLSQRFGKLLGSGNFIERVKDNTSEQNFKKLGTTAIELAISGRYTGGAGSYEQGVSSRFLLSAGELLLNAPKLFDEYIELGLRIAETDIEAADRYFSEMSNAIKKAMPGKRDALLSATRKIADKDPYTALDFLKRQPTPEVPRKRGRKQEVIGLPKTYTDDELLLDYIHDQHSAHEIGKLIDKEKYGKQYAQKCGGFY